MIGKAAIIGDGDSITVFKAAGVDAFSATDESPRVRFCAKSHETTRIIFLTEEFARPLNEFLKRFDEEAYPVVLSVPSKNGSSGYGVEALKSL